MTWSGKLIGAILGLVLFRGRWFGAVIGLVLGHFVDVALARRRTPPPPAPPDGPLERDDPYRTLEIAPTADDAAIETAYRRLIAQYHPDRVAGAAEEIKQLAETRARAINAAYERIRRMRGG